MSTITQITLLAGAVKYANSTPSSKAILVMVGDPLIIKDGTLLAEQFVTWKFFF